jgi:site-specific recombinase XerD
LVIDVQARPSHLLSTHHSVITSSAGASHVQSDLLQLAESANEFAASARSDATIRAYASDWAGFETWCARQGLLALPSEPGTVALYVADLASTYKPSTISRRLASISVVHGNSGHHSPTQDPRAQTVTRGVRRHVSVKQTAARPLSLGDLRQMLAHLPDTISGTRDRALLLLGFAGAFRRSELVALDFHDLERRNEGLVVHIRSSKTDQDGAGRQAAIPLGQDHHTSPVAATDAWAAQAGIVEGALFRGVSRHEKPAHNG